MTTSIGSLRLSGGLPTTVDDDLRATLLHAYSTFDTYRDLFDNTGVSDSMIVQDDPLSVLELLPVIDFDVLFKVSIESLVVIDSIVDMESSSGTTGTRKKRFISYDDDLHDHEFMAELFNVAGIAKTDRVACLDTDPVYLMVSFSRALDLIGVEESYVYSVGRDYDTELESLIKLEPTAIFVVPSMFERCMRPLRRLFGSKNRDRLRTIVFIGERVPDRMRATLESDWGIEVFSYYGAAETSSMGIECSAHNGIHLFTDRNLFELEPSGNNDTDGQLVVTSLKQRTLPLVRYSLGDEVVVKADQCPCGLDYPRVDVFGRIGDSFSILGSKFQYDSILGSIYKPLSEVGYMQIVLTNSDGETVTVVLPKQVRREEKRLKASLLGEQLELDFMIASKYAHLQFRYVDESFFFASRKMKLVDDRRETEHE